MGYLRRKDGKRRANLANSWLYDTTIPQAPTIGTSEIQSLAFAGSPATGKFRFRLTGEDGYSGVIDMATFVALSAGAQLTALKTALARHPYIGTVDNLSIALNSGSSPNGTYYVTFIGSLSRKNIPLIIADDDNLNQGTITPAVVTAGVDSTFKGYQLDEMVYDVTYERLYRIVSADDGYGRLVAGSSPVYAKTADYTVLSHQAGCTFTNTGASGTITFALPALAGVINGSEYHFYVDAAQQLRIDPNGSETVSLPSTGVPSAGGAYIVADAIGEQVTIKKMPTNWAVLHYNGTWTAV